MYRLSLQCVSKSPRRIFLNRFLNLFLSTLFIFYCENSSVIQMILFPVKDLSLSTRRKNGIHRNVLALFMNSNRKGQPFESTICSTMKICKYYSTYLIRFQVLVDFVHKTAQSTTSILSKLSTSIICLFSVIAFTSKILLLS